MKTAIWRSLRIACLAERLQCVGRCHEPLHFGLLGFGISEALALEAKHFINGVRTIRIEQQVEKDCPRVTDKLKTPASYRQIDVHPDVAEYLQKFVSGKSGLILHEPWLRKQRVQEDIRLHWLAHQPKEMSEVYSMLKEDIPARIAEAERVATASLCRSKNLKLFQVFQEKDSLSFVEKFLQPVYWSTG